MKNMKKEDFRAIELEKARKFKQDLDEVQEKEATRTNTFFGLTDDEIMLNKKEFEEMGLM